MAISGANLNGAFPIYDTSRSVNTYTSNLAKQAAQRAAEQKALQDDLGKIKIDGLRDADKEDYFKGFEDWRSTAQAAAKERDFRTKAQLQSDSDRKYLELQSLVNKSKEYGKMHQDVSGRFLDNKFRDQFTDDAVEVWRKSGQLPISSKDIVLDPTALSRQLDLSGIQKKITDIDEDLLKQAKYANPVTRRVTSNNRTGTESIYSRSVDPKQQALAYGMAYDTDRDLRAYMHKQYENEFASMPEDQAKAFAIQDMVKQRPVARQDAPKMDWDLKEDNWKEKALFNDALARKRKADGLSDDDIVTYDRKDWVKAILNKKAGSGERLGAVAKARGYDHNLKVKWEGDILTIDVPPITNEKTTVNGDKVNATASTTPTKRIRINANDPNAGSQLNTIINEITGDKISETKFKTGNAAGKMKIGSTAPQTRKQVPLSKVKGLVGKKGYEGYTEKELIDYYKSQGYDVK